MRVVIRHFTAATLFVLPAALLAVGCSSSPSAMVNPPVMTLLPSSGATAVWPAQPGPLASAVDMKSVSLQSTFTPAPAFTPVPPPVPFRPAPPAALGRPVPQVG